MINNIDVTLRDGGYQNMFNFPIDYVIEHVGAMASAGVEFVEIGYRNGSFKPIPNIGLTGLSSNNYIQQINNAVPEAKIVVMAHPTNIELNDLKMMKENGVNLLRLCIKIDDPQPCLRLCELAKSLDLNISINFTRVSQISVSKLIDVSLLCESAGADILYLADSNGSLLPFQVYGLVHTLKCTTNVDIGFHAHDHLGLAMVNSIEAKEAGATFIDGSLSGMGKGAGNLSIESWINFLISCDRSKLYDVEIILKQLINLQASDSYIPSKRSPVQMILGIKNLSIDYQKMIEKNLTNNLHSIFCNKIEEIKS